MKTALFHSFMDNIGGAEIFTLNFAQAINATIFTTNIDADKIKKMGFSTDNIISIGTVPKEAPFRHQLTQIYFHKLNVSKEYDLVIITGDWALAGVNHHPKNIWYVHSPIREIWDLYDYTRNSMVPRHKKFLFDFWVWVNRKLCLYYNSKVKIHISNSNNTKRRIKKYLSSDATVLHPPIPVSEYKPKSEKNYWLSVNRLIGHKRIEIQLEAFRSMPDEKLIIVGSYEKSSHFQSYAHKVLSNLPPNVEVRSWVDDGELKELYSHCKGLITTALDEDFGLTAIEALASGKPVIAPNEGGYKETVTHLKTGLLIDKINASKLGQAVKELKHHSKAMQADCLQDAQKYDVDHFACNMQSYMKEV